MRPILCGLETEYGLAIEGRGAEDQIEDAMAVVRGNPDDGFVGWDYRFESPRADLRGFRLERLAYDPEDAKFDKGKVLPKDTDVRSDRVLTNGARFYNDHGHPEYSTPECWSIFELARQDLLGEAVVLRAAKAHAERTGLETAVYKNNTDFHGASYGTHESYLMPRRVGWEPIYRGLVPMLVARTLLCGAGKAGSETGEPCAFQMSQRADFFVEPINAETLYRRPIFNTRDEPHADPAEWIRVHVIAGDANRIAAVTARKVGLVKLALALTEIGAAPLWRLRDPVASMKEVSRFAKEVPLEQGSWTTPTEILESFFSAAEANLELDREMEWVIQSSREILAGQHWSTHTDWGAKQAMLEAVPEGDPRSYDLEYSNVDPDESLFGALLEMGSVAHGIDLEAPLGEGTRARARAIAVREHRAYLTGVAWGALSFEVEGQTFEVPLLPDRSYGAELEIAGNVRTFIDLLRGKL